MEEGIPDEFLCPITLMVMKDPVVASDGQTYERTAIQRWLSESQTSPLTRQPMINGEMRSNNVIKEKIDSHLKSLKSTTDEAFEARVILTCDIFKQLDRLSGMDGMKSLNLTIPKIVVLGNESHGKSTLLERLIGFPVFPRDRQLCTRMPIRVSLRRGEATLASIAKRKRSGTGEITNKSVFPLKNIVSVVKRMMDEALSPGQEIVETEELLISIQLPTCPNLEILDLPGLVTTNSATTRQNLFKVTTDLAKSVINAERDKAIFLLVLDIRVPANQSLATQLVQDCGIQNTTLGVYTKLDVYVSEEDDTVDIVTGLLRGTTGSFPLPHGWVVTSSKPIKQTVASDVIRLREMDDAETKYITQNYPRLSTQFPQQVGMSGLRSKVTDLYQAFIVTNWISHIHQVISDNFVSLMKENASLGLPIPHHADYGAYLDVIKRDATKLFPNMNSTSFTMGQNQMFLDAINARFKTVTKEHDWLKFDVIQTALQLPAIPSGAYSVLELRRKVGHETRYIEYLENLPSLFRKQAATSITELIELLFKKSEPVTETFLKMFVRNVLSFDSTTKDESEVLNLDRFSQAKEGLQRGLVKDFPLLETKILSLCDARIQSAKTNKDWVVPVFSQKGKETVFTLQWDPRAASIPSLMFADYVQLILTTFESHLATVNSLHESCHSKRIIILKEMSNLCEVVVALEQLQTNVTRCNQFQSAIDLWKRVAEERKVPRVKR